jgi:hypothetical protein
LSPEAGLPCSPGFLRVSGPFGISAERRLARAGSHEPIPASRIGVVRARARAATSLNHCALSLLAGGPCDRGNLCRRRPQGHRVCCCRVSQSPGFLRLLRSFGIRHSVGCAAVGAASGAARAARGNGALTIASYLVFGPCERRICARAPAAAGSGAGAGGGKRRAMVRLAAGWGGGARVLCAAVGDIAGDAMKPCPRRIGQGSSSAPRSLPASSLPRASQAECDTLTDFPDTSTDFRDT